MMTRVIVMKLYLAVGSVSLRAKTMMIQKKNDDSFEIIRNDGQVTVDKEIFRCIIIMYNIT